MPSISRRDFLNGVALTVAAGLTPAAQLAAQPSRYPPALTGLRGQHEGSYEVAHALAREGRRFPLDDFGGHAKRNEFTLAGRRIVGYGGSQSLQSPNALYSPVAKQMLRDLGVD